MGRKNKRVKKIKKQIEGFLTSEEAKITKKDALNLSLKAAIFSSLFPKITKAITSHVSHSQHSSCHSSCHDSHSEHLKHGSGCCPFLMVWNGKKFVLENNLLPQSENIFRKEIFVEDLYKLETLPKPKGENYSFKIVEFEKEQSFFRDFELLKITHPKEIEIGVLENKLVAFKNIIFPSLIFNSKKERINLKEFCFKGEMNEILQIKFENLKRKLPNYLIFKCSLRAGREKIKKYASLVEANANSKKLTKTLIKIAGALVGGVSSFFGKSQVQASISPKSIIFKLLLTGKTPKIIEIVHPRERFSLGMVDLSPYLKENLEKINFSLEWTASHLLSLFALAEPVNSNFKVEVLKPISISKNFEKPKKIFPEEISIGPGESLEINFPYKKEKKSFSEKTSFVLKTKGYYYTLY